MRLFIIGYKSSGKTTVGKKLANRLGMGFVDLDEWIERMNGRTVPEIFSQEGEDEFRNIEWKALKEVVKKDNVVVSTGGGAPCHCDNMNLMEKYGDVLYLRVDEDTLVSRLKSATKDRPIVQGKNDEELRKYVSDLIKRCEHHYTRAKYIVDGRDIKLDHIVEMLNV